MDASVAHGPVGVVGAGPVPPPAPPGVARPDLNPPVGVVSPPPRTSPGNSPPPKTSPGDSSPPSTRGSSEAPPFAPPVIKMPEPLPPGQIPEQFKGPLRREPPPGSPPSTGSPGSQWNRARNAQPVGNLVATIDNSKVAQITLNATATGGYSRNEGDGDEGLLLGVEPRDMSGNILDAPAEISVVLLDPALGGEAARVARWDFTEAQTGGMILGGADRGIHLELRWPSRPPAHDALTLFIRYTTHDGRKLQIERPVTVASSADASARRLPRREVPIVEPPPTRMATRPDDSRPSRPVWSPDRTY